MLCAVLAGLIGAVVVACNVNAIGRPCVNPVGADAGVPGTQISSPALECPSRLCLLQPPTASSMIDGGLASGINQDPVDGGVTLPTSCDIKKNPSSTCPNLHR